MWWLLGVVFRTSSGYIIAGASKPCLSSFALETEAKAALLAVLSAIDNNFQDAACESDSQELIRGIKGDFKKGNWTIFPLLIEIRNLTHRFHSISWRWIPRQASFATDWVAWHCKRGMRSDVSIIRPPSSLVPNMVSPAPLKLCVLEMGEDSRLDHCPAFVLCSAFSPPSWLPGETLFPPFF